MVSPNRNRPYKVLSMTDKTAQPLIVISTGKCIMLDAMLEFTVKEVYGVSRYYPDNRKSRCIVNHLMQQKCLTATQVKSLNIVGGFTINIKTGELI